MRVARKATYALIGLLTSLVLLAGCGDGETSSDGNETDIGWRYWEEELDLTDGRTVNCVMILATYRSGISCDWERAR